MIEKSGVKQDIVSFMVMTGQSLKCDIPFGRHDCPLHNKEDGG